MFSLEKFYKILYDNLLSRFPNSEIVEFAPFGTYTNKLTYTNPLTGPVKDNKWICCYFFDQEPIYDTTLPIIRNCMKSFLLETPNRVHIIANSEKSQIKDNVIGWKTTINDWYYFFHGFAALDWYRDYQYVNQESFEKFTKVFICYNHLISKYRSYRLHLVSNLIEQDLIKFGQVSLFLQDELGTWKNTIEDPNIPLDSRARVKIFNTLKNISSPLTIDTDSPSGTLSANVRLEDLTSALWHIVTETVYFFPKLHLTEKVFKPIIAQRPFILVAAVGNLAYLKSYGFKTFDRWIDESYDLEQDNYIRIEKITQEIARLCAMSLDQLEQMHEEMKEILKFNYDHFYGEFRTIITNEMIDNFDTILQQNNLPNDHLPEVKQRLLK